MPTPYDPPKVRTWEFENRAQRRQRQMAQFQQLAEEVRPHVLAGDYATAQALIAARVPGVKTPPAPPPPATPPPPAAPSTGSRWASPSTTPSRPTKP